MVKRPVIWMLVAYLALSAGFVSYIWNTQRQLHRQSEQTCRYVVFTRETQRGVVDFLTRQTEIGARFARTPQFKVYFLQEKPALERLRARTEPPLCDTGGK